MDKEDLEQFFAEKKVRSEWWVSRQSEQRQAAQAAQPAPEPVDVSVLDPASPEYAAMRNQLGVVDDPFGEQHVHRSSDHRYQAPIPRYRGQPGFSSLRRQEHNS